MPQWSDLCSHKQSNTRVILIASERTWNFQTLLRHPHCPSCTNTIGGFKYSGQISSYTTVDFQTPNCMWASDSVCHLPVRGYCQDYKVFTKQNVPFRFYYNVLELASEHCIFHFMFTMHVYFLSLQLVSPRVGFLEGSSLLLCIFFQLRFAVVAPLCCRMTSSKTGHY